MKTQRTASSVAATAAVLLASAPLSPPARAADAEPPAAAAPEVQVAQTTSLDQVVVTGSRQKRSAGKSSSPVDVIGAAELQNLGASTATEALNLLLPSFNLPAAAGQDQSAIVRAANLRGLNGDQTLVLVNGKRRHASAVVQTYSNINRGSDPVDLDMIPMSAIDHIEVLRDGASAQYGSDAIAGVINIILKKDDEGGLVSTKEGVYGWKDGFTAQQGADAGFKVFGKGSLHIAGEIFSQQHTDRSANAEGPFYYPLPNGQPDPREQTTNPDKVVDGLPDTKKASFSYNLTVPLSPGAQFYSFSTYTARHGVGYENFRFPNNVTGNRNPSDCPSGTGPANNPYCQAYPDGFEPNEVIDENDYQVLGGLKGSDFFGWSWDLSSSYGQDDASVKTTRTLNASLGTGSPTSFYDGSWVIEQFTNNADFSHPFAIGLAAPLTVSVGAEYRVDTYTVKPGEPGSYFGPGADRVFPGNPTPVTPASGAQSYSGFKPQDSGTDSRGSVAGYVDLETKPVKNWDVGIAGRFEHYDDFGNTTTGKLSTRYQIIQPLAIRGTVSNGFRAPAVAQGLLSSSSTFFAVDPATGKVRGFDSGLIRPDSPIARALGAEPLKPEKSTNYSAGLVFTPTRDLDVTLDLYRIYVRNRIGITGQISQANYNGVDALVVAAGGAPGGSFQYFTNAINTRTQGADLIANYRTRFGAFGNVRWVAEANFNQTQIQSIKPTPPQLQAVNAQLFDVPSQSFLTVATPRSKIILGADWNRDVYNVGLHVIRFGHVEDYSAGGGIVETVPARWITNASANVDITSAFNVGIGADNLFNLYPPETSAAYRGSSGPNSGSGYSGFGKYSTFSPYGYSGGFYYARLSFKFGAI